MQRIAGREKDHAGHLLADQFGGSPELDNLVSQSSRVNLSAFATLENQWGAAIENSLPVSVDIQVNYIGTQKRPASFDVYWKTGKKRGYVNIKNNANATTSF